MIDKNRSSIFFSRENEEEEEEERKREKRIVQIDLITSQTRMQISDSTSHVTLLAGIQGKSRVARPHTHTHAHVARGWFARWREGGSISNFPQRVTATRNEGGRNATTRTERTTGGRRQSGLSVIHALMIGAIVMSTSDPRGPFDSLVATVPRETTGFH